MSEEDKLFSRPNHKFISDKMSYKEIILLYIERYKIQMSKPVRRGDKKYTRDKNMGELQYEILEYEIKHKEIINDERMFIRLI